MGSSVFSAQQEHCVPIDFTMMWLIKRTGHSRTASFKPKLLLDTVSVLNVPPSSFPFHLHSYLKH
jgi:hypothetical protein